MNMSIVLVGFYVYKNIKYGKWQGLLEEGGLDLKCWDPFILGDC